MDGLLIVDKPVGPTSHDVVARVRRVLGERRVGHTGTLDPTASGVLPIVVGRATRLARFLSGATKTYEAVVRLGVATTTADAAGEALGRVYEGPLPDRAAIDAALDAFRGTFMQQPPAFSAKKIGGERSYVLARRRSRVGRVGRASHEGLPDLPDRPDLPALSDLPDPVSVTTHALDLLGVEVDIVRLRVECSAGFYVRSLAHDLGMTLGTGAHITALRRTRSGSAAIEGAVPLDELEQRPEGAPRRLIPMAGMLHEYPFLVLSPEGVRHAVQGRTLVAGDLAEGAAVPARSAWVDGPVRLLTPAGELLALATWRDPGGVAPVLHPSVVLG